MIAEWVVLLAALLGVASVALLVAASFALRRRKLLRSTAEFSLAGLLLAVAALFGTVAVAVQGYHAFTREELAAVITTQPLAGQHFLVNVRHSDGRSESFELAGDQFYVDAQILKWKPMANLLGLHTAYKLERVAGRYSDLDHERSKPRTVFEFERRGPLDMFELRKEYALFEPLLDAEYGSATYVAADRPARYELRVSTSGLLMRVADDDS